VPNHPDDASLVWKHMMHKHPPDNQLMSKYCQWMKNGWCTCCFGYPKLLQETMTIDVEGCAHYCQCNVGDEWVIVHCLPILQKFHCHINFEACSPGQLFQYIFKYIHKGMFLI
jgi:hypothetical protein